MTAREVVALNEDTPQLEAPQSGDTYLLPRDTTVDGNLTVTGSISPASSSVLLADGTVPLTANWDAGSFKITAQQLESDVTTGTAPLVVASTTMVSNLNADLLDGNEASAFATAAQGGLADTALQNIVEDTTPQLGGMLDVNGQAIGDGTLELLKFSETGSAVNEFTITNAATGNSPILSATGDNANVGMKINTKGSSSILELQINGTSQVELSSTAFYPTTDGTESLGSASKRWFGTYTDMATITNYLRIDSATVVASLPAASISGLIYPVSDADTPIDGSVVVGGGSTFAYVYSDGTNWRVLGGISPTTLSLASLTVDNITIDAAAITSDTGAISFDDENLTSTGDLSIGEIVITDSSRGMKRDVADNALSIAGGNTTGNGFNCLFYGGSHATTASDAIFRANTSTTLKYDHSAGLWDFQAKDVTTTGSVTASAANNVQSGTSYTIQASDNGKNIVFTNGSAIAVSLPDTLATHFQCTIIQAGAGVPTVTPNTDTINGAGTGVTPDAQWKGMYLTQYADTTWLAIF